MAEKVGAYNYRNAIPNALLQPDGSVTDFSGKTIRPANEAGKRAYELARAIPNKVLMEDNTIKKLSDVIGGGGSGAVSSVNGMTGIVMLSADDVGAIAKGEMPEPQIIENTIIIADNKELQFAITTVEGKPKEALAMKASTEGDTLQVHKVINEETGETVVEDIAYLSDIKAAISDVLGGAF